ncbi:hypothetical protein LTR36_009015 [Oleoguttula mirabilis]|uniref:Uncharacterized protein n=1 Tax=Oleoguttula mirabilis TaxID=1507867 RepID=A0AAV9J6K7_9PEZI|nr:hypothetical protein LTR36_009015 [Oleoguttula mirabilis]
MSSGLMETEAGGESGQYEGNLGLVDAQKKSGGQLGSAETTTDPAQTEEAQQQKSERGEKTAENVRYGQAISEEGGVGGVTQGQEGSAAQEGYGGVKDQSGDGGDGEAAQERRAEGYGGERDMDRSIGA